VWQSLIFATSLPANDPGGLEYLVPISIHGPVRLRIGDRIVYRFPMSIIACSSGAGIERRGINSTLGDVM
jgi:hypothetical protein